MRVGELTVELRVVAGTPTVERSAAEVLRDVGPWEGETHEELVALFANTPQTTCLSGQGSLLGLFADEPEVVDEAMKHAREWRSRWRGD